MKGSIIKARIANASDPTDRRRSERVAVELDAKMRELGFFSRAFAIQTRFRVGRRGVRRVRAFLAVEVDVVVAAFGSVDCGRRHGG